VTWFRGYLVVVSHQAQMAPVKTVDAFNQLEHVQSPVSAFKASPMRDFLPNSSDQGSILTIYDLKSKYIAFRGSFGPKKFDSSVGTAIGEPIRHIVSEWGELFVITEKKNVRYHLS
jgi:vacuolar protein sorting-associated protein 11